jgi:SAM-dependent methyltransferase/UDP-N-acetylglucosamine transferase subunit ALG13
MTVRSLDVVVTVGMGRWPFDRLVSAIEPLCAEHRVFAQTGTSTIKLSCEQYDFVPYPELLDRMKQADVVITHAGNTVRLVQRMGKLPIVVARTRSHGEMADDHQVDFLEDEERAGRVHAVWELDEIPALVQKIQGNQPRVTERCAPPADPDAVAATLDALWGVVRENPFRSSSTRRYAYAWEEVVHADRPAGPHLDVGCNTGDFAAELARAGRAVRGADVHAGYVATATTRYPEVEFALLDTAHVLPYDDASFATVSLLDVLEHCADEAALLSEIRRVLIPGGLLVLTVPAKHLFSALDPDNVKFHHPRLHRWIYSARFGKQTYEERFVDTSDGLYGDIAIERTEHTNYIADELFAAVALHGFALRRQGGANLFWRLLHGPSLLAKGKLATLLDRLMLVDGRLFTDANLFATFVKQDIA